MALPDKLERLRQISIDTLGLSQSTSAGLKWYGITSILDCITFFYKIAQQRDAGHPRSRLFTIMFADAGHPRSRLFTIMFAEVEPALIAAGYWMLVMDAEVWRILREQKYEPPHRMVVRWLGQDIDLYETPFGQLGITQAPPGVGFQLKSIGACITVALYFLKKDSKYWLEIDKTFDSAISEPRVYEYLFWLVQPRLIKMGLWAFVEEHLDDFDTEEEEEVEIDWDGGWETFDVDDPPIHVVLLRFLIAPITLVAEGLPLLVQAARAWLHSRKIKR